MTPQGGAGGTGPLYEHTAVAQRAAEEDVVIPHPEGDVVAKLDEPSGSESAEVAPVGGDEEQNSGGG
jgi:hypothetical protein